MNKELNLKKIEESNFIECFNLKLAQGQEKFVSYPIRSLAQAYVYYNQCSPFGIYKENAMVGYVMQKLGFKDTGNRDDDEIIMKLVI